MTIKTDCKDYINTALENGDCLSATNRAFYSFVKDNGLDQVMDFNQVADAPFMKNYQHKISSWPLFISPQFKAQLFDINHLIPPIIYKSLTKLFAGNAEKMAEALGLSPILCALFFDNFDASKICFRTDVVYGEEGCKVLEFNIGTNLGGWQVNWIDLIYREKSHYKAFFTQHDVAVANVPVLFFKYLIKLGSEVSTDGVVRLLLRTTDSAEQEHYGDFLNECFNAAVKECGMNAELFLFRSFSQLQLSPKGVLFNDLRMDLITLGDTTAGEQTPIDLMRMIFAGQIRSPDSPALIHVLGDKRTFALMYEALEQGLLSEEENIAIRQYVPESYILKRVNDSQVLKDKVYGDKDRFVLKPCDGFQGNDVSVGRFMTEQQWQQKLSEIEKSNGWLVQEYCESRTVVGYSEPNDGVFDVIWGVFSFADEYGGCWVRNLERNRNKYGVINSHRGAEERIVYESSQ